MWEGVSHQMRNPSEYTRTWGRLLSKNFAERGCVLTFPHPYNTWHAHPLSNFSYCIMIMIITSTVIIITIIIIIIIIIVIAIVNINPSGKNKNHCYSTHDYCYTRDLCHKRGI